MPLGSKGTGQQSAGDGLADEQAAIMRVMLHWFSEQSLKNIATVAPCRFLARDRAHWKRPPTDSPQRIPHRQAFYPREIAIRRPDLPNSVLAADRGNTGVVNSAAHHQAADKILRSSAQWPCNSPTMRRDGDSAGLVGRKMRG